MDRPGPLVGSTPGRSSRSLGPETIAARLVPPLASCIAPVDAPVETVYAAWTDPEHIRRWFAPGALAVARAVVEVEVGERAA